MSAVTPDEYRVRVFPSRRWHLFGRYFGRSTFTVEIDYLGAWDECGDHIAERHWTDADQIECAIDLGLTKVRELHEHAKFCADCSPDPDDTVGPLVVHVGGRTVIDDRTEVAR